MLDFNHGSEKTYLRLFIKMAESNNQLNKYADVDNLRQRLYNSISNFEIFSEQ